MTLFPKLGWLLDSLVHLAVLLLFHFKNLLVTNGCCIDRLLKL